MIDYDTRLTRVRQRMTELDVNLLYLSPSANLHYVTGLRRERPNFGNVMYPGGWVNGAFITRDGGPIFTVPRMTAEFELPETRHQVRVLPDQEDPTALVRQVLANLGVTGGRVAIEDRAWAWTVLNLQALLPGATFILASEVIGPLRMIKSEDELAILHQAGQITEAAYADVRQQLHHGMTELDIISEVDYQLRCHGAEGPSFVTSLYNMGPAHTIDFHDRDATLRRPLEPPVSVSFDFGAIYQGYCYDFGRSVWFGEPPAEYRQVYELVLASQAAGIVALRAGEATGEAADAAARALITDAGYGEHFRHRLGHGIGMDVHEPPFLTVGDGTVLREGMCFTVEPSIFIPGQMGARIEDVVVVRPGGGEPLTTGFRTLHVAD